MREEQWSSHSTWLELISLFVFTRWTGNKSTTTAYPADHVCFIVRWLRRKFRHERVGQKIVPFFRGNSTATRIQARLGLLSYSFCQRFKQILQRKVRIHCACALFIVLQTESAELEFDICCCVRQTFTIISGKRSFVAPTYCFNFLTCNAASKLLAFKSRIGRKRSSRLWSPFWLIP